MKNKIFDRKKTGILLTVVAVMLLIGSFFDYQISTAVFDEQHPYAVFFAAFGEVPAFLCLSTAGILLIKNAHKDHKVSFACSWIFGVLFNLLAFASASVLPGHYLKMPQSVGVCIGILLVAGMDLFVWKMSEGAERETLTKVITLFLLVPVIEMLLINIIKIPWGRPRMRMIAVEPEASFQPWWIIGSDMKEKLMAIGVAAEEFKSFPSGHTGNAACAMLLGVYPVFCKKLVGKENLLFGIGLVFTLLVACSRVVAGAHFLTDVSVGLLITSLTITILYRLIFMRRK